MRLALVFLLIAPLVAAEPRVLEELLPKDTRFVVSVRPVSELVPRFKRHPVARLLESPALEKPVAEALKNLKSGDRSIRPLLELITGPVVAAGVPPLEADGQDNEDAVSIGVIDFGELIERAMRMGRELTEAGDAEKGIDVPFRELDFRGTTIRHRTYEHEGERHVDVEFRLGSLFVATESLERARALVARAQAGAGGETLASTGTWRALRRSFGRDADVFFYAPAPEWSSVLEPRGLVTTLGLDQVEALAGALRLRDDGIELSALVSAPNATGGVFDVVPGGGRIEPSPLLPPDWGIHILLSMNAKRLVAGAVALVDRFQPGAAQGFAQWKALLRQNGFPFDEMIDSLGSRVAISMPPFPPRPEGVPTFVWGMQAGQAVTMAIDLKDQGPTRRMFENGLRAGTVQRLDDYLGYPLYRMNDGSHMALTPDRLVFARNARNVQTALRRYGKDQPTLRTVPAYRRATKHLPDGLGLFVFAEVEAESEFWKGSIAAEEDPDDRAAMRAVVAHLESMVLALGRDEEAGLRLYARVGFKPDAPDEAGIPDIPREDQPAGERRTTADPPR